MQRWKITIEYDGRSFHGWQRQPNVPSVQETIEKALKDFCQQDILIQGAGRTDAGVHAMGQVAHFDLDYGDRPLTPKDFRKALNALVRPHPVSILKAEPVEPEFHARFLAKSKLYTYRMVTRAAPTVLEEGRAWYKKHHMDVEAMKDAATVLLGHHDFTTFRDSSCQAKSPIRTLERADIEWGDYDHSGGQDIKFHFEAQSFLHHQVRNMVGTLSLVGEGKWTKADLKEALEAKDRTKGGLTCPAEGLYLVKIDY